MNPEVPLTPSREHRRELSGMRSDCYPVITMTEDANLGTVINVTCDHGATATVVSWVERVEDPEACEKAVVTLLAQRHASEGDI